MQLFSTGGRGEKCIQNFGRKTWGKEPLRRSMSRWDINIVMDYREIVWEGVEWIHLAKNRDWWLVLVKTITSFWIQ
jgi:hypothetical protein